MCIRELTGGIYFGEKGRKDDGNTAFDNCVPRRGRTYFEVGYEYAMKRNKTYYIRTKQM